jgi:hypothetical protein
MDLGIERVADLRGRDPERLYRRLCSLRGRHIDRCVLYVFRCAVYVASHTTYDPHLLKWWHWKDSAAGAARRATPPRDVESPCDAIGRSG